MRRGGGVFNITLESAMKLLRSVVPQPDAAGAWSEAALLEM